MNNVIVVVLGTVVFALAAVATVTLLEERTYVGDVENQGYIEVPNE